MKEILNISIGSSVDNYDELVETFGEKIRIKRLGVDYNFDLMKELVLRYDGKVDVISLSGLPNEVNVGSKSYIHFQLREIRKLVKRTALVDGKNLRELYVTWCLRQFHQDNNDFFSGKRIAFYTGAVQRFLVDELELLGAKMMFADPYVLTGLPVLLRSKKSLDKFLKHSMPIVNKVHINKMRNKDFRDEKLKKHIGLKCFLKADVFIGNETQLELFKLNDLSNKTLIVDYIDPSTKKILESSNAQNVISCFPDIINLPRIGYSILEAIFQSLKEDDSPLSNDDVFEWIDKLKLNAKMTVGDISLKPTKKRFAFVVHPLSAHQLTKHPAVKPLRYIEGAEKICEKAVTYLPGFSYGKITGIQSQATGQEVEGLIYAVSDTPKMMMSAPPERIYKKLIKLSKVAFNNGCKIIGLGAYTKIVGDAGVSVSKGSPIPVTTGNSLSAASTLWAASLAIDKLGFVSKKGNHCHGSVMIVGATGSIGMVSAKLLCQTWDEVIIVAPRAYKLLELADELRQINPRCKILYSTDTSKYFSRSDLVITTTSAQGKKILNIEKAKPGAVICDVSRPFDVTEEEARKRPDVLVIASGEVELPGNVKITCDLGLDNNVVYACLAETALLALENRMESFSLSRQLSYEKVKEIDLLARKHGIRLSAIMGHNIEITDEEIDLCREHAIKKLQSYGKSNSVSTGTVSLSEQLDSLQ